LITAHAPDEHAYLDARAAFIEAVRDLARPAPDGAASTGKPRYRLPARVT